MDVTRSRRGDLRDQYTSKISLITCMSHSRQSSSGFMHVYVQVKSWLTLMVK
jgi:hypothetical protein